VWKENSTTEKWSVAMSLLLSKAQTVVNKAGKLTEEADRTVMISKQFKHMTVKNISRELITMPKLLSDD